MDEIEQVEGNWGQDERAAVISKMKPTDNMVFKSLVFSNCGAVSFSFVVLSVEVLHGLIIQETVGMDPSGDDIPIVHLSAELSPPTGQNNSGDNWGTNSIWVSDYIMQTHCMRSQRLR